MGMIAGLIIVTFIIMLKYKRENVKIKRENKISHQLLLAQKEYYSLLLQKDEETRAFRHDIKEHMTCMRLLYEQGKTKELGEYLLQIESSVKQLIPWIETGNLYVNIVLSDLQTKHKKLSLDWTGKIPPLTMKHMDICTLFYNLISNATESAERATDKTVRIVVKVRETSLVVVISNHFSRVIRDSVNYFRTTKTEEGHGYGLKNIRCCVAKYNGFYKTSTDNHIFSTEVILPDVIREEIDKW